MSIGREIRDKIKSVQNTKKITTAMQMVAASKMRKTQERMHAAKPYAEKIRDVISHVALSHSEYRHPFMEHRDVKRVGYIVVTADRGLCGGLNNNLLKATIKSMKDHIDKKVEVDIAILGGKGMAFFKRMGGNVVAHAKDLGDHPDLVDMIGPVKVMLDAYLDNRIDMLYICYNSFITTLRQEPTITQLIPLVQADESDIKHHWDYIYEPDNASYLLENLLTRYVEAEVYRAGTENIACEMAARMTAMKAAGDNAQELISSLQLAYNKARQAGITRELSEIVAGASVL